MLQALSGLPRRTKKLMLVCADFSILTFALWASFYIRLEELWPKSLRMHWEIICFAPLLAIPIFYYLGLYNAVIRFLAPRFMVGILKASSLATLILYAVVAMGGFRIHRTVYVLYWVISCMLLGGIRMIVREYLPMAKEKKGRKKRVIVYGSGAAGTQTAKALRGSIEYTPIAFVDDDLAIQGLEVLGIKVYSPNELPRLVDKFRVDEIVISIPSADRSRLKNIIDSLSSLKVVVKKLPGLSSILDGKVRIDDIRVVDIEDLLGRDPVAPIETLIRSCISGKSVLVSGAGGSIGSELCRQIAKQEPKCLVLYEISEFGLYTIEQELAALGSRFPVVPVLGSVLNQTRLAEILAKYRVQTIYHAAAYKHVPLVEENVSAGVLNNIFGTLYLAKAAVKAGVNTFILISTDKAVRPTSIMGASKRFAELILQGMAQTENATRFTMVRFGNVLGSSGSVVPLFRRQIRSGGPVTVTHKDMTRYFMTIPEAAQLVIQAGSLGRGGDLFLLDMGKPVKIYDLAVKMIQLSGLSLKTGGKNGDIAIKFTGSRPGEKMFEELLIGDKNSPTEHPRICRAEEESLPWPKVEAFLAEMELALKDHDSETMIRDILKRSIGSYRPQPACPTAPALKERELKTATVSENNDPKFLKTAPT